MSEHTLQTKTHTTTELNHTLYMKEQKHLILEKYPLTDMRKGNKPQNYMSKHTQQRKTHIKTELDYTPHITET